MQKRRLWVLLVFVFLIVIASSIDWMPTTVSEQEIAFRKRQEELLQKMPKSPPVVSHANEGPGS